MGFATILPIKNTLQIRMKLNGIGVLPMYAWSRWELGYEMSGRRSITYPKHEPSVIASLDNSADSGVINFDIRLKLSLSGTQKSIE